MAYRLRLDESVADGLRRLARKELKSAADTLRQGETPDDDAIHEARKSMKKVRAIVHLVDADGGRGLGRATRRLRDRDSRDALRELPPANVAEFKK